MSRKESHITREQLIRYLKGTLPEEERSFIEERVREDEFLAVALEGLSQMDDPHRVDQWVERINQSIDKRVAKSRPFYKKQKYYAAAAVIAVLISVGIFTLISIDRKNTESLFAKNFDKYPNTINLDSLRELLEKEKELISGNGDSSLASPEIGVMEEVRTSDILSAQNDLEADGELSDSSIIELDDRIDYNYSSESDVGEPDFPKEEKQEEVAESIPEMNDESIPASSESGDREKFNDSVVPAGMANKYQGNYDLDQEPSITETLTDAIGYYKEDRYAEALTLFQSILANDPTHETALFYGGISLLELDYPDEALAYFNRLLKNSKPEYEEPALWYKGLTLLKLKKKKEAKKILQAVIDMDGEYRNEAKNLLEELK